MKGFAVLSGLFLAILLTIIGYGMAMRDDPRPFMLPILVGSASLLLLPLGYWMIAKRRMRHVGGGIATGAMLVTLAALWLWLLRGAGMWTTHALPLVIWSAVWLVANLPFQRLVVKQWRRRKHL